MNHSSIGASVFLIGVGLIVLRLAGQECTLETWTSPWGGALAWTIRAGLTAVGGALWLLARRNEAGQPKRPRSRASTLLPKSVEAFAGFGVPGTARGFQAL